MALNLSYDCQKRPASVCHRRSFQFFELDVVAGPEDVEVRVGHQPERLGILA